MSRNLRKTTEVYVLHVTASRPLYDPATTPAEERARRNREAMEAIRRDHVERRGWRDIGYHAVTFPDGETLPGRPAGEIGAHVRGFNSVSYGHAIYGGLNDDGETDVTSLTPGAIEAAWIWAADRLEKDFPEARVCGHRDLSPDLDGDGVIERSEWTKLCPLFDAIPEAARRGLPVMRISGEWAKTDPRRPRAPDSRIAYLQRLLTRAGHPTLDDGHEGPRTATAIRAFQSQMAIPQTGAFDLITVARLRAEAETGVEVVTQAPIQGLDKSAARSSTVWTGHVFNALTQTMLFFSDLPLEVKIAASIFCIGALGYLIRERMRYAEAARRAAEGDPLPAPEPDFLDHLFGALGSIFGGRRPVAQ